MLVLVGSHALKQFITLNRIPVDYDYIGHADDVFEYLGDLKVKGYKIEPVKHHKYIAKGKFACEFEIAWEGSTGDEFLSIVNNEGMTLNLLYALKLSHRYLKNSPHFLKTLNDIKLMEQNGAILQHKDWFKKREKETIDYKHPKLNTSKTEFFDPNIGVKYVYNHDTIHLAMKHLDKPAYEYFKEDEVKVSKSMFFTLPKRTQLYSVLEEAQVLALERSIIPFNTNPRFAFNKALEKVCTSISSGWWREFAYNHYHDVQAIYEDDYVSRFWLAVDNGIVLPFKET